MKIMSEYFGHRQLMSYKSQGFEQYPIRNANYTEEENFINKARMITTSELPPNLNIFISYVLYRVNHFNDDSSKHKTRTAPHGNEDGTRTTLAQVCSSGSPTEFRTDKYKATIEGRIQVLVCEVFIIQNRSVQRNIHVRPPQQRKRRILHAWILLVVGLVLLNLNENGKKIWSDSYQLRSYSILTHPSAIKKWQNKNWRWY